MEQLYIHLAAALSDSHTMQRLWATSSNTFQLPDLLLSHKNVCASHQQGRWLWSVTSPPANLSVTALFDGSRGAMFPRTATRTVMPS